MRSIVILAIIAALLYLIIQAANTRTSDQLTITMLDVGQGDAIYLRLPTNEDILVDTGPDDRVLAQLGQTMPIGDRTIELLIISHNHADHLGGLLSILEKYEIKQLWISGALHEGEQFQKTQAAITAKQIPTTQVKVGDRLTIAETELTVLFPPPDSLNLLPADQHDATVVVKATYRQFCLLLTGDLNTGQGHHEDQILSYAASLNIPLDCPALKITHHGSSSGSTLPFLQVVTPEIALISVGQRNRYHHPAPTVLERLKEINATIYRTDQQGAITIKTNGQHYWTKTER